MVCARNRHAALLRLLTRAAHLRCAQSIADASGLVMTGNGVVLATAFFGVVAYLIDKSAEGLKADVKSLKDDLKSLDNQQRFTTVVSVLTLLTVLFKAAATSAHMR